MSHSVLSSFDPLATHPFTNNSGLLPKPAAPSQYPRPIPSASKTQAVDHTHPRPSAPSHLHAPQPKRPSHNSPQATHPRPIFVPFRPERSSPELDDILLKKKVSDVFANKAAWSIDQSVVPLSVRGGATR